jgi:8-oxo-dGTP diphosphatase
VIGLDGAIERVRLGAYAWVEDAGRVVVVRVAPGEPDAGRWFLPGGGLDFGEDPADGVLRELVEETGLVGSVHQLIAIRSSVVGPAGTRSGHRVHAVEILYRVMVVGGELRDEVGGSSDLAAWVPLDALDRLPRAALVDWARTQLGR